MIIIIIINNDTLTTMRIINDMLIILSFNLA